MEVVVITSQNKTPSEIRQIIELFNNGLESLVLRKSKWRSRELEAFLEDIPIEYRKKIIIHGHYRLAFKYGLKGIHLRRRHRVNGWRNKLMRLVFKLRRPNIAICTTFNSLESLRENTYPFDFVFLNSVFSNHSHYNSADESGINMLRSVLKNANTSVYAMGGVKPELLPVVKAAGFDGVGLSSYVWKDMNGQSGKAISAFKAA